MADISRADALALINRQNAREIWQAAAEFSAALRTFRKVDMGTKQVRYPVIGALPTASFVTGEDADSADAVKPTTNMTWTDRTLEAEEIGGIVVIPENVIDDASNDFDLWGEIKPRIAEAVGATLDGAVFFGTNAPATWPDGLVPQAIAAGNVVSPGAGIDVAEDINLTIGEVLEDGYDPTAIYARRTLQTTLRGLRDTNDSPIWDFPLSEAGVRVPAVFGITVNYVTNGAWDVDRATVLVGDPRYAILGIRQDLTFKFLDQASVTLGGTLVSLAERDLLGLRFKMRVGFQTAETATKDGGSTAFPFAVLSPSGS
jgi:HK97 family phage major capsid protein